MTMPTLDAQMCYILCFPDPVEKSTEPPEQIRGLKDAPYFQPVDVSVRALEQARVQAGGVEVSVSRQRYDDRIQVIECKFPLSDVLDVSAIQRRESIEDDLLLKLIPAKYLESGLFEEYIVLMIHTVSTSDAFVEENARRLAHFIRTQREPLDETEVKDILVSRVRYSRDDLTIVDWDGAIIIAPDADFQSDIELLKIGNYQLLRYRMLDQRLETSLRDIAEQFRSDPRRALRPGPTRGRIRRIVQHRLELMLDFEHTDQNLLLIGDWYTAKLYEVIREELYLDNWKEAVHTKLDNMESIIETIQENFSLSWSGLMEQVELIGWIILLIGYFVLFFIDAGLVK
ncbi:MAG: hypothetical protein ACOYYU_10260 [Chloroflexota bacterium]